MMQYDKTFKEEALRLSDEIGLKNATAQLSISYQYTSEEFKKALSDAGVI